MALVLESTESRDDVLRDDVQCSNMVVAPKKNRTMFQQADRPLSIEKALMNGLLHAPGTAFRKRPACVSPADEQEGMQEVVPVVKKARLVEITVATTAAVHRRTVHFEEFLPLDSNNDEVITHVRVFDRVEDVDATNCWYTADEMIDIMSREKSAISVMSYCCDHYTTEVLNLMKLARSKTCLPHRALVESASPLWVANSPARGLERDIVSGFKQRKRQVIQRVLQSQRVLKSGRHQVTGERAPIELQSHLLSTQYQKWSHPMVRFAQVLAEGDAQLVVDNAAAISPNTLEVH